MLTHFKAAGRRLLRAHTPKLDVASGGWIVFQKVGVLQRTDFKGVTDCNISYGNVKVCCVVNYTVGWLQCTGPSSLVCLEALHSDQFLKGRTNTYCFFLTVWFLNNHHHRAETMCLCCVIQVPQVQCLQHFPSASSNHNPHPFSQLPVNCLYLSLSFQCTVWLEVAGQYVQNRTTESCMD